MTLEQEEETKIKEQEWMIDTMVKPQLPNLLETLMLCSELLTSKVPIKLPITSARTEHIKGVLTRVGLDITEFQIVLDLPTIGKKITLQLKEKIILEQLQSLLDLIEFLTQEIVFLQHDLESNAKISTFHEKLNVILQLLIKCNQILNKPTEDLMFPKHYLNLKKNFNCNSNIESYQDKLTIDFFLLNGELSIECKSLHKITHEPWDIVRKGKSYIDELREDLKHHKTTINEIIEQNNRTGLNLKHALGFNKFTVHDYLTRGVTFGESVVIEMESSLVHCQDPNLLSVSTKIKYLEHQISKMYKNLDITMI